MDPSRSFATTFGICALRWRGAQITAFRLAEGPPPPPAAEPAAIPPEIARVMERAIRHLAGDLQDFRDAPYAWDLLAPFPAAVLRATLAIPPGRTASYGDIARAIGEPVSSSRAVAAALGANPWPLLVPCHRILGGDGRMTGYSGPGGVRTKARLLALEGAQLLAE